MKSRSVVTCPLKLRRLEGQEQPSWCGSLYMFRLAFTEPSQRLRIASDQGPRLTNKKSRSYTSKWGGGHLAGLAHKIWARSLALKRGGLVGWDVEGLGLTVLKGLMSSSWGSLYYLPWSAPRHRPRSTRAIGLTALGSPHPCEKFRDSGPHRIIYRT